MVYRYNMLKIALRYYWRIFCIKQRLRYKEENLWLAVKLFKLAHKLSPDFFNHYDRAVIEHGQVRF